jgi:hypothetical protein
VSPKKRVQALPFLHAFCPTKSLTRGEENIPQTIEIKQSPCQLAFVENRCRAARIGPLTGCLDFDIPASVHSVRNRRHLVQKAGVPATDQLIRTRNWMVNEGFPPLAALMTPAGAMRTARTAASKPLPSGVGT